MLPVQNLFGGATTLPSGMVNSPLLAGFGAGQNMQDQFTNTQLNQDSQNIQNQQQQNILDQARLDNPNLAAQRSVTAGNLGVQQSLLDSGQQLAAQGASLDAKTQAAISQMSDSQMNVIKNHSAAYMAAAQYADKDPSSSMPGSAGNKQVREILSGAGIKNLPDVLGPQDMQKISARAAAAPQTVDFIQHMQQGAQKVAGETNVANIHAASAKDVAGIQAEAHVKAAEITALAQKSMESVAAQIIKKYNADPNSVNSREIAEVQNQMVRTSGPLVLNAISTKMNELNDLDKPPEQQAKNRTNVLINNVPGYAQMEAIRLKKVIDEAKDGAASGATAPAGGAGGASASPKPLMSNGRYQIKSTADYNALKDGDPYTDPEGHNRVKGQ